MSAAQHQGVHPRRLQRGQVLRRHRLNDHVAGAEAAVLHQGYKEGAGLGQHPGCRVLRPDEPLVGAAADGRLGADEADAPASGGPGRGAGRRGHHSQDRDGVLRRQHVQRGGGHGAAGDDDSLEIEGAQEGHVLPRVFHNGLPGAAAVRYPSGVPEIDDILLRQQAAQLPYRGQPAQAGVEHANGSVIQGDSS